MARRATSKPSGQRSSEVRAEKADTPQRSAQDVDVVTTSRGAEALDSPLGTDVGRGAVDAGAALAAPIADGLGGSIGESVLADFSSSGMDFTADLPGQQSSEPGHGLDGLASSDIDQVVDLDIDGQAGGIDGRLYDDGFGMGDDGPPADSSEYVGDGEGAAIVGGLLAFGAALEIPIAVSTGAVSAAAGGGYALGTVINDNIVDPLVWSESEPELGEGETVEEKPESTNEHEEDSGLLEDQDHGGSTAPDESAESETEQSTEPEPDTGQSQEPGTSTDGAGNPVSAEPEDDTAPAEDRGPDGVDPVGAGNSVVGVDLRRCRPILKPHVPHSVPVAGLVGASGSALRPLQGPRDHRVAPPTRRAPPPRRPAPPQR